MLNPIPKRLKEARKKTNLSQKNLGIKAGIDESSASGRMNQYEKDKHTPDIVTLKNIAKALDVPIAYFYCEDDQLAQLVCIIDKLDDNQKEKLLDLLQSDL